MRAQRKVPLWNDKASDCQQWHRKDDVGEDDDHVNHKHDDPVFVHREERGLVMLFIRYSKCQLKKTYEGTSREAVYINLTSETYNAPG